MRLFPILPRPLNYSNTSSGNVKQDFNMKCEARIKCIGLYFESVPLLKDKDFILNTSFEQSRFTIGWLWSFAEFPELFDILEVEPWVRSAGSGLYMNPSLNFFRSLTSIGFEKNKTSIGIPQLASPWYRFWYLFKDGQPLFTGDTRFEPIFYRVNWLKVEILRWTMNKTRSYL